MATKHYKASKPNRIDPTRTVMVRKRFVMELRRRFARLRGEIVQLLLDDVFGIRRRMIKDVTVRNIFCPTGEGGGVDPSCSPEAQEAVAWVYAQDPWRDKVTTEEKTVAGKDIRPAPGIAIVKRTVAKYEKLIEKENAITRRIVVAQDEDGKYFIHDGNHYFRALINLKKAGKLQHVKELPVVVVKPKGGYRFETKEIAGGYYHQLVANVFCPTGPGGGIDPSCSKDGGGSSSVSSGKDSAKLELAKLKKTAVQKSAPPSNGETFDQVTKRLPETMAKQVRSKFYLAQTVVFESMDELRKSGKVHDTDHAEASYDRSTRTLYLAKDSSESAIAHEIGHILDGPSRHITSDPQFVRTARKEAKNLSEYAQTSPEEALAEYLRIQFEEGHKAAAKKAPGMTKALIKKGYKDITQVGARVTNAADDWQFKTNSNQVKAFQQWLRERFGYHLSIKQLMKKFAEEGYKRGIGRAFDDIEKPYAQGYALDESTGDFYKPSKMQFLKSAFASPVGKERVEQLASRSFDDLKNVTGDMATRMSRTLLEGLVDGSHPNKIAKSLSKDLDISLSRAETIARTEIIRAHAEGQLDAMQAMGVAEVGVQVEWITAQDDAVCPRCEAMEGIILEIEKAHNMIPMHPNCRCAFMPAGDVLQPRSVEDAAEAGRESVDNLAAVFNIFCPTGEGGGVDPTCSPSGSGSQGVSSKISAMLLDHHNAPEVKAIREKVQTLSAKLQSLSSEAPTSSRDEAVAKARQIGSIKDELALLEAKQSHNSRASTLRAFGVPVDQQPMIKAYTGPSTSHATQNWEKAKNYLQELCTKDGAGGQSGYLQVRAKQGRAEYDNYTIKTAKTDGPEISAHEFGHHLEKQEWVRQAVAAFRASRFDSKDDVPMTTIAPLHGYGKEEVGNQDKMLETFKGNKSVAAYCGKIYPDGRTEILSMGLQMMYEDPVHLAEKDPQYFSLIIGILQRGRHGSD